MGFLNNLLVPEAMPYLLGILGMLLLWQFYKLQVFAGRVQAVDFWDRSGIRLFVHVTVQDGTACHACQSSHGAVVLPSVASRKGFSTLLHPCTNPAGCRCLVAGIYGAWREAHRLVVYLQKQGKRKPVRLTDMALGNLLGGNWERTISGTTDRIAIHMMEAFRMEGVDPDAALFRYRYVIDQAKAARDLHLVVAAYFRLTELLEQRGRPAEALEIIDGFESRYAGKTFVPPYPTETQRGLMSIRKAHLTMQSEKDAVLPTA